MQFETETLKLLAEALANLEEGFASLPDAKAFAAGRAPMADVMAEVMAEVASRLRNNYPYFHPLYAGQMLKPPHPIARAAYALATWINPNNHALDGKSRQGSSDQVSVSPVIQPEGLATAFRIRFRCTTGAP
jgi:tyrosine decarboxylase / aspartate 1-decarboxylase